MSGHSQYANIRFRKERQDAKRGKIFTKLNREITIAARVGGGDVNSNPRLRKAVQAAKTANMPMKNIENAIKKGTGELPGLVIEEVSYEGYGPGGVAMIILCTTDNKNRTVGEVRHLLSRHGGNLGEPGCVGWMFERKGLIRVNSQLYNEENLLMQAIEAGADDFKVEDEFYEIYTSFDAFDAVIGNLEEAGIQIESSEITYIPQNTVPLDGKQAEKMLKLMDALDDNDDVQNVYANFDIDKSIMESLSNN